MIPHSNQPLPKSEKQRIALDTFTVILQKRQLPRPSNPLPQLPPLPKENEQDELATQEEVNAFLRQRGIIGDNPKELLRETTPEEEKYMNQWSKKIMLVMAFGYSRENPPPNRKRPKGSVESLRKPELPS